MAPNLATRLATPVHVVTPAPHLGLTWDISAQEDCHGIAELVVTTEAESAIVRRTPDKEIMRWATRDDPDAIVKNLVGKDSLGQIQAFGAVRVPIDETTQARAELFAVTRKKWRKRGIGRALLAWQDAMARQILLQHFGENSLLPVRILNVVEEHMVDRRLMYVAAGFSPKTSIGVYVSDLSADPGIRPPKGTVIRSWEPRFDAEARSLYTSTQAHLGATEAESRKWWNRGKRLFSEELSFALFNEEGQMNAVALTCKHSDVWLSSGKVDGAIDLVAQRSYHDAPGVEALISHISSQARAQDLRGLSIESVVRAPGDAHLRLMRLGFQKIASRRVYRIDL
ncbi:MAG: GNAT family N-acetyltransferase [Actinomycetaceae bacterium]|nr:GNAT family N-acetyltransferase [Actinomycetaceae bacterium]